MLYVLFLSLWAKKEKSLKNDKKYKVDLTTSLSKSQWFDELLKAFITEFERRKDQLYENTTSMKKDYPIISFDLWGSL